MRINVEISSVEDEELGRRNDIQIDRNDAGELAGYKVRLKLDVVAFGECEFGKTRLPFELIDRHCCWRRSERSGERRSA